MSSSFPASVAEEIDIGTQVNEYTPSATAGETAAKAGELMYFDTADQKIKRCGADPSLIAGICEGSSEDWKVLTPNGKIPLRQLTEKAGVKLAGSGTPAETDVGVKYGIVRDASGNWCIDTSDTVNTRVIVYRVDPANGAWYVRFLAANLQFNGIVS